MQEASKKIVCTIDGRYFYSAPGVLKWAFARKYAAGLWPCPPTPIILYTLSVTCVFCSLPIVKP